MELNADHNTKKICLTHGSLWLILYMMSLFFPPNGLYHNQRKLLGQTLLLGVSVQCIEEKLILFIPSSLPVSFFPLFASYHSSCL